MILFFYKLYNDVTRDVNWLGNDIEVLIYHKRLSYNILIYSKCYND